ncbi:hypothetical protein AAMO2058_001136800 [Amorphochlora amoebiformis]
MESILRETEKHLDYKSPKTSRPRALSTNFEVNIDDILSPTRPPRGRSSHYTPHSPYSENLYSHQPLSDVDMRLGKMENESEAFRDRIVGDLESAFTNAVRRIETMREDMIRMIRSNSNDLEAQMRLTQANMIKDHNQRETEFRQRVVNQMTLMKRNTDRRAHELTLNLDNLSQKLGTMRADVRQCQTSTSSLSVLNLAQLAARVEQNQAKIEAVLREQKSRNTTNGDTLDSLQNNLDRVTQEVRSLNSKLRSMRNSQNVTIDEKVREAAEIQRKRQDALEEQLQRQLTEMKSKQEGELLSSVREISLEHVNLNTALVDLHTLIDENLALQKQGQQADEEEREEMNKSLMSKIDNLDHRTQELRADSQLLGTQTQEALGLARKAEMGREADRKTMTQAQDERSKIRSEVADLKLQMREVCHKLDGEAIERQKRLEALELLLKSLRSENLHDHQALKSVVQDLKHEDNSQKSLITQLEDTLEAKIRSLDAALQAKSKNESTKADLNEITKLRGEFKHSLSLVDTRITNMNESLGKSLDAVAPVATQKAVNKTTEIVENRVGGLHKVVNGSLIPMQSQVHKLEVQLRETMDSLQAVKRQQSLGNRQSNLDIDQKFAGISTEIDRVKKETKREIAHEQGQVSLLLEHKLRRMIHEATAKTEQSSLEQRQKSTSLDQRLTTLNQAFRAVEDEQTADRKRIDYCSQMIFTYGVQIIKEADVRSSLRDVVGDLCNRVDTIETHTGSPLKRTASDLGLASIQEGELNNFNEWLAKSLNITPQTSLQLPPKGFTKPVKTDSKHDTISTDSTSKPVTPTFETPDTSFQGQILSTGNPFADSQLSGTKTTEEKDMLDTSVLLGGTVTNEEGKGADRKARAVGGSIAEGDEGERAEAGRDGALDAVAPDPPQVKDELQNKPQIHKKTPEPELQNKPPIHNKTPEPEPKPKSEPAPEPTPTLTPEPSPTRAPEPLQSPPDPFKSALLEAIGIPPKHKLNKDKSNEGLESDEKVSASSSAPEPERELAKPIENTPLEPETKPEPEDHQIEPPIKPSLPLSQEPTEPMPDDAKPQGTLVTDAKAAKHDKQDVNLDKPQVDDAQPYLDDANDDPEIEAKADQGQTELAKVIEKPSKGRESKEPEGRDIGEASEAAEDKEPETQEGLEVGEEKTDLGNKQDDQAGGDEDGVDAGDELEEKEEDLLDKDLDKNNELESAAKTNEGSTEDQTERDEKDTLTLEEKLKEVFDEIDVDGSGFLDIDEFFLLAEKMGRPVDEKKMKETLDSMDKDENGLVTFQEMCDWWNSHNPAVAEEKTQESPGRGQKQDGNKPEIKDEKFIDPKPAKEVTDTADTNTDPTTTEEKTDTASANKDPKPAEEKTDTATNDNKGLDSKEKLKKMFDNLDVDGSGFLDISEFKAVAEGMGRSVDEERLKAVLNSMDKDGDSLISFDETCQWWENKSSSNSRHPSKEKESSPTPNLDNDNTDDPLDLDMDADELSDWDDDNLGLDEDNENFAV